MRKQTLAIIVLLALMIGYDTFDPALHAQQAQTPTQIIEQIGKLLEQLQFVLDNSTPAVTRVATSAEMIAAVAKGGDIEASPGIYTANLTLAKTLSLRGPSDVVLQPADPLTPTITVTGNDINVTGITVLNGAPDRDTIVVGSTTATSADTQPHRVRFTAMTVTGKDGKGHRGFALHGVDITLDRVTVTGFAEKGRDSQAVWICNGPGPYFIVNSTLEASGENFLVGGSPVGIVGMNPSDITFRGNTVRKPASYHTTGTVKNLLELKTGVRVLIEGNTFDGNWPDGQSGNAIVFTVRGQAGQCPWCEVNDVIFRGNTVKNSLSGFAVNILGKDDAAPSVQTRRITLDQNLFQDSPHGIQVIGGVSEMLTVTNNTFPGITGRIFSWSHGGKPLVMTPVTFSRNVAKAGAYFATGDGTTVGLPSMVAYSTVVEWNENIIESKASLSYPAGTGNTIVPVGGLAALLNPTTFKLLTGTAGY